MAHDIFGKELCTRSRNGLLHEVGDFFVCRLELEILARRGQQSYELLALVLLVERARCIVNEPF